MDIPNEIVCQQLERLTDPRDINAYRLSSRAGHDLVNDCVKVLWWDSNDTISLKYILRFPNLEEVYIRVTASHDLLKLSNLPKLRKITIELHDDLVDISAIKLIIKLLKEYHDLSNKDFEFIFGIYTPVPEPPHQFIFNRIDYIFIRILNGMLIHPARPWSEIEVFVDLMVNRGLQAITSPSRDGWELDTSGNVRIAEIQDLKAVVAYNHSGWTFYELLGVGNITKVIYPSYYWDGVDFGLWPDSRLFIDPLPIKDYDIEAPFEISQEDLLKSLISNVKHIRAIGIDISADHDKGEYEDFMTGLADNGIRKFYIYLRPSDEYKLIRLKGIEYEFRYVSSIPFS